MERASMLANFPGFAPARMPQDIFYFYDDFLSAEWSVSPNASRWYHSPILSATGGVLTLSAGVDEDLYTNGGLLAITTEAQADYGSNLQGNGEAFSVGVGGYPLYFECRFRIMDITNQDIFVGLSVADPEILTGGATDIIGFQMIAGALAFVTEQDTVAESTDCVITETDGYYVRVAFYFDGNDTIYAYVDENDDGDFVLKASRTVSTSTDDVPNDMNLTPTIESINGATASAEVAYIDYILCAQQRFRAINATNLRIS